LIGKGFSHGPTQTATDNQNWQPPAEKRETTLAALEEEDAKEKGFSHPG